ncbi:hypothetical protein E2C01_021167 [Portunus trituberculatus]|uniref:Uncharacterized protein n=1 Tax=Portunus trituberculatus TaxID=210409 RepID=A0A5B7E5C0_PORTR|nr:hypothetical protein [Portunus trituberculatus]
MRGEMVSWEETGKVREIRHYVWPSVGRHGGLALVSLGLCAGEPRPAGGGHARAGGAAPPAAPTPQVGHVVAAGTLKGEAAAARARTSRCGSKAGRRHGGTRRQCLPAFGGRVPSRGAGRWPAGRHLGTPHAAPPAWPAHRRRPGPPTTA